MKTLRLVCALFVGMVTVGSVGFGQETAKNNDAPVLLRYHFHAKDVHNIKMMMAQKIDQVIQGQEMTMNQTLGFGYRMDVLAVDDKGNADTKMTYTSALWKQDSPMGNQEYDSTKPSDSIPPEAQGFAGLVGQSIMVKFAPNGQVLTLTGVDEMQQHMLAKLKLPAELAASMEKMLKEQFGDKALKESFEQMTRFYPSQAVKVGDVWNQHVELTKGFPLIMDSKYTLTARGDGISTITVKSSAKSNPKAAPMDLGAVKISYDLTGEQGGTLEIDESSGWMRRAKMTQRFSGTMGLENSQLSQPLSVPVTIDGTVTITSS